MTQIKSSESVSQVLISAVHHRSDGRGGWLWPGAVRARTHDGASWPSVVAHRSSSFSSYGGWFSMRFAPTGSRRWGERDYANLNRWRAATEAGNGRRLGRCLATVRAASGEALTPRTCTKASLSSLLASRPTNWSERRWKTRIWWLPRVRRVLYLRLKIRTLCGGIFWGF
jgi:hypothetical protein